MQQINSFRGLSSIKAISKYEVNQISGFRDIAFKSNGGQTDGLKEGWTDGWTEKRTGSFHNTFRLLTVQKLMISDE